LNATAVTTSGNQTYAGAVTLGGNTNLTGTNLITTVGSTIAGAGFSMNITGNDFIGGDISGVNALTVSGTTALNANVSTTGSQTYTGAMTLGSNAALLASNASAVITTHSSINSDGTARALSLNSSGGGSLVLNGALGNTAALANVTLNAATLTLNGSSVNTTGNQSYTGAVTLTQNTVLQSSGANATIAVADAINSDSAANRSLNISASGAGSAVSLGAALGNTFGLSSVNVSASTIALNSGTVTTSGNQFYAGAITLGLDTTLLGATVITGLQSSVAGAGKTLNISGNASFGGNMANIN
jgi:hypothetical protein